MSIFKITPGVSDNERGDIEIKDYVVLSQGENNDLPPLILDFTLTHDRFGSSHLHPVVSFRTHMARDDALRDPGQFSHPHGS